MRLRDIKKKEQEIKNSGHIKRRRIIAVDDEQGIIDSLNVFLTKVGYEVLGVTDPLKAIEIVKNEHFDLMLLDFLMEPIHGDKVIEEIRKFNDNLYIILLTGHKDLAPPLDTIRRLNIQGYCEKSDKKEQLLLLIESGIKSVEQVEKIVEQNKNIEKAYIESIETLRMTVEAKDTYTRGHSDRVAKYSVEIGKELGLSEADLKILKLGAQFHDIGKIGIPDSVLLKPDKLTEEEYATIKKHAEIGANILKSSTIFKDIIPIVLHHHERWDGKGYPKGLKGEEIPYLARICSISDTFDAITSKRSYRDANNLQFARDEIEKNIGTQFGEKEAKAFLKVFDTNKEKIIEIYNTQTDTDFKKYEL